MSGGRSKAGSRSARAVVRAAGGVVVRPGPQGPEVLVVHRPRYDDWSLPKGKRDRGETDALCALREVREETSVLAELGPELTAIGYTDHRGRPKQVRYWRMAVTFEAPFDAGDEVDRLRWLPPADAVELLTYPTDRDLVGEALGERPDPSADGGLPPMAPRS